MLVQLDPDVAEAFPDAKAVNEALCTLIPKIERRHDPGAERRHKQREP